MSVSWTSEHASLLKTGAAGPDWLIVNRACALERFTLLGFPSTKNEDWHYTNATPIAEAAFRPLGTGSIGATTAEDIEPYLFGDQHGPLMVFVNGVFAPALSRISALPSGVRVLDLARAMRDDGDLLKGRLTSLAEYELNAFTALNTTFFVDGAVVIIGQETVVDEPMHLLYFTDERAAERQSNPRTLIVAERFSKATVIESYVGREDVPYFTNAVSEVVLEAGATLAHLRIQREAPRAFHVGTVETQQARDSHYQSFSFAIGAALSRSNIYTSLDGEGCGATLNGLYMLDGRQHGDHQTRIEHFEPNCFSRELYKGILDGASHGVFNGKVYVHPKAQKTDGKQTNNTLLLSNEAQVDTKPQLEIFADDVKCTHGATVGRIDETATFYMKSRGVSAETTRKLLTYAFAAEVLETIEIDPIREALEALTLERFAGGGVVPVSP